VQEGDTLIVGKTFSTEDMVNTLQKNNENLLEITTGFKAITTDFQSISKKLTTTEGTVGKLLNDNTLYDNVNMTTESLKNASKKAQLFSRFSFRVQ
jgi:phospholipid/cholesterol/gamma-HCH transport system substrate-binding protein